MNHAKKLLSIFAFVLGFGALAYATNISVQRFVVGPTDTEIYNLDDDGDITAAGSITVPTVVWTGTQGLKFTGTVITSSGTTTPSAANILAIGNQNVLLISTGTGTGAWTKVGAQ